MGYWKCQKSAFCFSLYIDSEWESEEISKLLTNTSYNQNTNINFVNNLKTELTRTVLAGLIPPAGHTIYNGNNPDFLRLNQNEKLSNQYENLHNSD